jgi:hypothetical protein
MPPKLKVRPPKDDEGGVPPPSDGGASGGVSGGASGGATLAASARGCVGAESRGCAATSDEAPKQPSIGAPKQPSPCPYIDSLSALEQHVCRIAESHLESSFDLSRSTGYIAWKVKNGI